MTRQETIDELLSRRCDDYIAVGAMRAVDRWVNHEPFDYPTAKRAVLLAAPLVVERLQITGHPKHRKALELVQELKEYPIELFHRLRKLVHFEYVNDGGEECRI